MRILKRILLVLVVIIALLVVIAFFLPRKIHVERTMTMNAPAEVIFEQVNDFKHWEKWSPWHLKDPNIKLNYNGPTAGEGATFSWESDHEEVGNGRQQIIKSVPYDSITSEMYFMESQDPAYANFYFTPRDSGTTVRWTMDSDMGMNPFMRWMGLMMEKWVGTDYEKGLENLRKIVESTPAPAKEQDVKIELSKSKDMTVATVKDSASLDELSAKLGTLYGEIMGEMKKAKGQQAGPVFAIYHSFSQDKIVVEAGIPVEKAFTPGSKSRVKVWDMKGTDIVLAHHYGSYRSTEQTHYKVDDWVKKNNKTIVGAPWEVYVTDPGKEPDTSKWYTQVIYPVQ